MFFLAFEPLGFALLFECKQCSYVLHHLISQHRLIAFGFKELASGVHPALRMRDDENLSACIIEAVKEKRERDNVAVSKRMSLSGMVTVRILF